MDVTRGKLSFLAVFGIFVLMCSICSSDSSLEYDSYRDSCPEAHQIIRSAMRRLYDQNPRVAPAFLRLVFHDCFIQGCDGSVLLDAADGMPSEKDSTPNQSLRGFEHLDDIKTELENICPGVISCADLLVLAARESVILAGGPFYPLQTGRRDSNVSFALDSYNLPSPDDTLEINIDKFAQRGFTEREIVSLLGAHSTGMIHCKFFENRLYDFEGTAEPDPSLDADFLDQLRSRCNSTNSPSPSSASPPSASSTADDQEAGMKMDYEGPGSGFGSIYYRGLLQGRGILFVDQQLTAGDRTENFVRQYAADVLMFRRDFAQAMMKLSSHQVLTGTMGNIRRNCRKVDSFF